MLLIKEILSLAIAYLLGSIPFAYILARLIKGIDIREVGTHNAGTMNIREQIGVLPGLAVLILDMGKGALSIFTARWLGVPSIVTFLAGFAAVAGHTWPVYLNFRGGRGTATTLGVLVALAPHEMAICFPLIVLIVVFTRDTGLGVGIGLTLLVLLQWILGEGRSLIFFTLVLALFLVLINLGMFRKDIVRAGGWKKYFRAKWLFKWRKTN